MSDLEQVPVGALWILAVASNVVLGAAVLTLPRTGRKGETARRVAGAVVLPLVCLVSQRVIFARYLQRVTQLARSGNAVETATGKQVTIFLLTMLIVFAAVAASLAVGLSSMPPMASG